MRTVRRLLSPRRRDERGAVFAIVAVSVTVLLLAAALAVDLGKQRVTRSDVQAAADVVSLDLARNIGNSAGESTKSATLQTIWFGGNPSPIKASADRNDTGVGNAPTEPAGWFCTSHVCLKPDAGTLDLTSGAFTALSPTDVTTTANAVRVTATAYVDFDFTAGSPRSGAAVRTAVARAPSLPKPPACVGSGCPTGTPTLSPSPSPTGPLPAADRNECYKVGSFALGVDTSNSILGPLLGINTVSAQVLSSSGIATAQVSLAGLATKLGAGTPDQLARIPGLTIGQFLLASADVLDSTGDTAHATLLRTLNTDLGAVASDPMSIAQILSIGQSQDNSALDADVGVADLVTGALLVADGGHAISVPGLGVSVPGVGNLAAKATVVQPPVIGCNGGTAKAAQVTVSLTGGTGSLVSGLVSVDNIGITLTLANAWAVDDRSGACNPASMVLDVSNQTLANIRLTASVHALSVLGISLSVASLDTGAPKTIDNGAVTLQVPDTYTTPVVTDSGQLGIDLSNTSASVLGIINLNGLGALLQPVVNAVSGLVTTLGSALGITVAGADLWAISPTPECAVPRLGG